MHGESQISEHLDGAALAALEVGRGKPLAASELVRRTQDRLGRVAALLPNQLVRCGGGESMLAEEPLCAKVVVFRHRAHYVLTAHLVPRDRMCHWILSNVFRTPCRCTARRATADGAPCAGLIGRRTEHVHPGQFRPAITPPSTLRMAPVIQLAPSDNR